MQKEIIWLLLCVLLLAVLLGIMSLREARVDIKISVQDKGGQKTFEEIDAPYKLGP